MPLLFSAEEKSDLFFRHLIWFHPVSYTHLDVYKRQGLFSSPFFVVSKSTHFRTKEGANIMKRYGYHRTSTREQHLDRGIKEDVYKRQVID